MTQVDPKIVEAKEKAEAALLKLPGVTGVDIGYKEVGGKPTDQIAIRVLVEEKKDVPKAQRVPDSIDGFATDVIQRKFVLHQMTSRMKVEDLHPMVDAGTYTPLKGGISIGPCRAIGGFVFAGTLGCVVRDNGSGAHMLLSNFHVMCVDNTHAVGDTMTQPSRVDGGACPGGIVGTLARQSLGGKVDCAVAAISGSRGNVCEIVDIGAVAGQGTASLGMKVRKRGRTTMLTYGEVDSIHLTVTVDYEDGIGNVTLTDQIGIKPDTAHNPKFGDHGDSGSVVVDDSRKVVGLYFAGDDTGYGVANPIAAVLSALNVSLCTGGIKIKDLKDLKLEKIEHKELAKEHKIEIKEHKNEKHEIKELKIEKNEHKELKVEIKDAKIEIKEIAKLEHPEKRIDEKGGKELKEGGFEGGPGFPGGPGDPGPIFGGGGGIIGQAAGGGKLTDVIKFKELKPEIKEKEQKAEGKDIKSEKPEAKPESKEAKEKHEIKEKAEHKVETKGESKNEAKDNKNEAKDHKPEIIEKPDNKLEWKELKDHKHEKPEHKFEKSEKIELKERKLEKHENKELKIEKIEQKEISKLEHGEKQDFKEKDGKELKEAGFEGPGPGGPGDPGPIFGQAASGGVSPMKAPKEAKEFKVEKVEQKEFKESGGKEIKFEKNEIKELKPEKIEKNELKEIKHEKVEAKEHKNELKDHKHEKPEHKIELKEHKNEKAEIKELHKEVIKELAKEISKLEHGEKPGFKEKDGKELKEGGFEGPGGPGDPIDPAGPIFGQRLDALEQAVASLSHFISADQRPDLTRGALSSEPDLAGQSSALAQQAKAAKDAKDAKDVEKIADR